MNTQAINRKQFLRGRFKGEQVLRPPWAITESAFTELCERCGDCIKACSSHIIKKGDAGFPEMNFEKQGCDYCGDCLSACSTQALQQNDILPAFPAHQIAIINNHCFASRGIVCRSCGEVCEHEAIKFKLAVGGISHLQLNTLACDGCGECVHVCPANAIQIQKSNHGDNA